MIDIDITLLFQMVNFIVTLVVLNMLLIRPIRDIVSKRRELASGFLRDAERFNNDAAERLEKYETTLAGTREQGAKERETQKAAAAAQESALLAAAHAEAQDYLHQSREETRKAVAAATQELLAQIPVLAAQAAARLLDTKHQPRA